MARKLRIFIFVTVILASVLFAHAQQPSKFPRIGYLTAPFAPLREIFRVSVAALPR